MLVILSVSQQQSGLDAIHEEESLSRSLQFAPNRVTSESSVASGFAEL